MPPGAPQPRRLLWGAQPCHVLPHAEPTCPGSLRNRGEEHLPHLPALLRTSWCGPPGPAFSLPSHSSGVPGSEQDPSMVPGDCCRFLSSSVSSHITFPQTQPRDSHGTCKWRWWWWDVRCSQAACVFSGLSRGCVEFGVDDGTRSYSLKSLICAKPTPGVCHTLLGAEIPAVTPLELCGWWGPAAALWGHLGFTQREVRVSACSCHV